MAEMSKELMDLINSGGYCYLATASKEGMPNIAIIGSTRAVSPDTVVLAAGLMNKNLNNLQENPKASIIVYSGLPSDKMQATKTMLAERMGPQVAEMTKAAIVLKVDEVYSVGLGPQAGKRIS
jgi:predicted pyridoxine 5'-phosphate oxidase superfamily flavin-nucleotide-binding protein